MTLVVLLVAVAVCAIIGIAGWCADRPCCPGGPPRSLGFWMTEDDHRRWIAGWRPMTLREAERWHVERQADLHDRHAKSKEA